MSTKIIKRDGAYVVVSADGTLLTPPMSLEKAKQYKTVIDSFQREKERLDKEETEKNQGHSTDQKSETLNPTALKTEALRTDELNEESSIKPVQLDSVISSENCGTKAASRNIQVKNVWISVSEDLKTQVFNQPNDSSDVLMWIHKTIDRQYNEYLWLYNYELFSPDLKPFFIEEENFTCIALSDFYGNYGYGTHYSIRFDIIDKNIIPRSFCGLGQMEQGIIETMKFMKSLTNYIDWADYDSKAKMNLNSPKRIITTEEYQNHPRYNHLIPITSNDKRLPEYLRLLNSKLDLSRAGQEFVITRPGIKIEQVDLQRKIEVKHDGEQNIPKISEENQKAIVSGLIEQAGAYANKFPNLSAEEVTQEFKVFVMDNFPEIPEYLIDEALCTQKNQYELSQENVKKLLSELIGLISVYKKESPDLDEDEFQKKAKEKIIKAYPNIPESLVNEAFNDWKESEVSSNILLEEVPSDQPEIESDKPDTFVQKPIQRTMKNFLNLNRQRDRIILAIFIIWVVGHLTLFVIGLSLYTPSRYYHVRGVLFPIEYAGSKYIRQNFYPFDVHHGSTHLTFNCEAYDYTELFVYTVIPIFFFLAYRLIRPPRKYIP